MVYQRGNQKEGSPHYVFLYSDDENSGDEENFPLQTRTSTTSSPRKVEVINVIVKPEDTLQALALRYRCTISELKRINKIHKENEIYARRHIKVPIQPFSILTESLDQTSTVKEEKLNDDSALTESDTITRVQPLINLTNVSVPIDLPKTEINNIILNSVCEPLATYKSNNTSETYSTETDQLLNSTESEVITQSHIVDTFKCSGDDCGLSWTQLLGATLLLGLAGPIIYILYITSKENH
ncbi:PREDICTED: lysM and putative peptidoglycan-binding domain-containing protein 4 [Polistes dominula]|uniref:LysM and putative peptidoglycan-binding domain-containing protein 4 n=1 Tax=Polistes dominula TaxID=743375 RepID=A0ABM1II04_POLDO|nr:PREDICTED: lysM and putative peptidoglycan-binding domain-containing protein 4 [Polistes dominula]